MKERLVSAVDEIREIMASIHRVFEQDSEDVQREWVRFTQKVDRKLEDALRHVVKKSLQVGVGNGMPPSDTAAGAPPS